MKRTKSINLDRMKKRSTKGPYPTLKPLALVIAATTFTACGSNSRDAKIYRDVAHCIQENPSLTQQCETAYDKALTESADSGPKYKTERDCVAEFGQHNCVSYRSGNNNWFMPAVAGFMFAKALDRNYYHSSPVYTSYSRNSPGYGQWTSVDGNSYGRSRYGSVKVRDKAFQPKPKVTKTMSRGGFGSKVAAKSNWGGSKSSSRRSWGG